MIYYLKKYAFMLVTVFLTLTVGHGQTNVYHPFPDSNAIWNIHFDVNCFMNGTGNEDYSIIISGDTLINNQTYHKLTTPYVLSYSTGTCGGITTGYKGAIRQDTTNKKVFFIPPADTTEKLLYDFTMQVGDTVKGYIGENALPQDIIVQSIDSVLAGSNYRKRWVINPCYQLDFIEGIGSTYGLIKRAPGCAVDQAYYTITCFQQNGQALYPDTTANCQLITSLNSIDKIGCQINAFPNPSNGSFTVNFGQSIKEIRLADLLGNTVLQQMVNNTSKIEISNLQSGYYTLTAIDKNNKTTVRKIIICDI